MTSTTTLQLSADERQVCQVLDTMYAAWAAGDAAAVADLYTEDATVVMPGVCHAGRETVRAWFDAGFAGRLKGSRALDESRRIRFANADAAIVTSRGGILMAGESAVPAARFIRATWVLARQDGRWLIAAYHNCPEQPA
jgi:uncharacterized protein (TIGR02246 family)